MGSSQEPSSSWEFMATNSSRNEEGGGMYGGEGRASPDLLPMQGATRKRYTYTETQTLHLPSGRHPTDTAGRAGSGSISRRGTMVTNQSLKETGTSKQGAMPKAQHPLPGHPLSSTPHTYTTGRN